MYREAVSFVYKGLGRSDRDVMEGGALEIETLVDASVPVIIPSLGIISHVIASPCVCGAYKMEDDCASNIPFRYQRY